MMRGVDLSKYMTLFSRWVSVASYDNSQSEINVMFEYKYYSLCLHFSFLAFSILFFHFTLLKNDQFHDDHDLSLSIGHL